MFRAGWVLGLAIALGACGDDGGDPDASTGPDATETPGLVELGQGTVDWAPVAADATMEIFAGPQGGHHFIVHGRVKDMIPGDPTMPGLLGNPITRFSAYTTGDNPHQVDMNLPPYRLGYEDGGDGFFYLASGRLLILEEAEVEALYDTEVELVLYVEDASGVASRDERVVMAVESTEIPDGPDAGAL